MLISGIAILIYILGNAIREIVQIYQQKWHYLLEPTNFISWLLYLCAIVMVSCLFFGGTITDNHFSAASMTVFLSWFNLLLFLQRFDQVGIYVVMFLEILQTLIKVLLVFSILIIAFGFAFYILLSNVRLFPYYLLAPTNLIMIIPTVSQRPHIAFFQFDPHVPVSNFQHDVGGDGLRRDICAALTRKSAPVSLTGVYYPGIVYDSDANPSHEPPYRFGRWRH